MRRINRFTITIASLLVAALACNLPQSQPASQDPGAPLTAAAQTVSAQLTQSAPIVFSPTSPGQPATGVPTNTLPAATIPPAVTFTLPATSTQQCDKATFVADITIPDGTTLNQNQAFTKTWRIRNTGTCSWTPSYAIVFDHGNQLGGPSVQALTGNVNPGETVDISVNLLAPGTNGDYTGYWKMRNASGVTFSQFYVQVKVLGGGVGPFAVTSITYSLSTWNDAGHTNCPRVVAQITVNAAGTVTFKWTRADVPGGGATETVTFGAAGTKNVKYDWARGSVWAGTPTWVGIYVTDPNNQDFGHRNFSAACTVP